MLYFCRMSDQNPEYPYNIPGAKPPPPPAEGDSPTPPAPQDPQAGPEPGATSQVRQARELKPEAAPEPESKPETQQASEQRPQKKQAPELKAEVQQGVKKAGAPATKKPGLPLPLIVGIVLFGFAAAGLLFSFLTKVRAGRRVETARPVFPVSKPKPQTVIEEAPAEEEEMASLAAVTQAKREMPRLTLGGILYSEGEGSVALINGKIVPEGGVVKGVKVVRVLPDKVEMEFDGRRIFMRSL